MKPVSFKDVVVFKGSLRQPRTSPPDEPNDGLPSNYLETSGVTEEERPKRRFGEGSVCEGPDEVNL